MALTTFTLCADDIIIAASTVEQHKILQQVLLKEM